MKLLLIITEGYAQCCGIKAAIDLIDEIVIDREIEIDSPESSQQKVIQCRVGMSWDVIDASGIEAAKIRKLTFQEMNVLKGDGRGREKARKAPGPQKMDERILRAGLSLEIGIGVKFAAEPGRGIR